jgi:hypothetical protein
MDDLRQLFIQAYLAWKNAKTFQEREITWREYCQIRDLWAGTGRAFSAWLGVKDNRHN